MLYRFTLSLLTNLSLDYTLPFFILSNFILPFICGQIFTFFFTTTIFIHTPIFAPKISFKYFVSFESGIKIKWANRVNLHQIIIVKAVDCHDSALPNLAMTGCGRLHLMTQYYRFILDSQGESPQILSHKLLLRFLLKLRFCNLQPQLKELKGTL